MIGANAEMRDYLERKLNDIISIPGIRFSDVSSSVVPAAGGVYAISRLDFDFIYVGRTKNLHQRIYTNHLMGNLSNASLKRYLINQQVVIAEEEAKKFLLDFCSVRFVLENDYRKRGAIEGFLTGVLFPKFGIDEEH